MRGKQTANRSKNPLLCRLEAGAPGSCWTCLRNLPPTTTSLVSPPVEACRNLKVSGSLILIFHSFDFETGAQGVK